MEENDLIALNFSEAELDNIIKEMEMGTAPGPDGFQKMLPLVKH
jgi:hypothetical protein